MSRKNSELTMKTWRFSALESSLFGTAKRFRPIQLKFSGLFQYTSMLYKTVSAFFKFLKCFDFRHHPFSKLSVQNTIFNMDTR